MTLGFTGVVWYPRGATVNSTTLNGGIGPAPLTAASSAWASVSTSLADATLTITKVMADLAVGWEGTAATAALSRLAPFQVWTEEASAQAATASAKAAALATAHTVARATMPSLAEIAVVQAAKVAAYAASGALAGAGAAAEAADRAMDLRASLVMEAYESASTIVTTPQSFTPPPPLSNAAAAAPGDTQQPPVPTNDPLTDFLVNPAQAVQNAVGAALAQPANPAVVSAASQAGSIVGTGLSTVAQASASFAPAAAAAIGGAGVVQTDPAAARATTGAQTHAARAGSGGMSGLPGSSGSSRVTLPDGWGGGAGNAGRAAPTGVAAPIAEPVRVEPAAGRSQHVGAPMGSGGAHASEEEERRSRGYLKNFEHFEDGRVVIPSVIGGDR
ncbi:PPE domain-containing protein [Rhodococcus gannanensis]|uniref:PPE domain-containing protein n=1 Tax=Rhodococcus gannanensis TaxID=1960308 RepID=A0ABW4P2B7_9NOCA